jgi:glycosyltransferase involved in cell wall biosynthesis
MHILIAALHRPSQPTGVCRHAANLARCLSISPQIQKITLVIGEWQRGYFKQSFSLPSDKIDVISINIKNSSASRNIWFLFGLPVLVKRLSPNVVHLVFPLPFVRALFNCPVVTTIHDLYPCKIPDNFGVRKAIFNKLFLKLAIHESDVLACVSKTTLNDLEFYFPSVRSGNKKAVVVYNFVEFSQGVGNHSGVWKQQLESPFLLCVAQHRKNKNLDVLIQAFAEMQREESGNGNYKLVIVGSDGPETESLKQLIQSLSLTESILMLSGVPDNELCWLYQHCKLFIIPSSIEGFCIPLIEALYFSCAIVCSDIPIFREIGDSVCTYFKLDGAAITNLKESMSHTLSQNVSYESDINKRFSRSSISSQLVQLYSDLVLNEKEKKCP